MMPELPEVETVRRGLEKTIVGKTVKSVDVRESKIFNSDPKLINDGLVGASVTGIERRAKLLIIRLSSGWILTVHLKMTGQLIVEQVKNKSEEVEFVGGHPEKVYERPLPHKHTHVIIHFTDGTILYFNDLRKFGWMRLFKDDAVERFFDGLNFGPEPLSSDFTWEYLAERTKGRKTSIKQLLLDQKIISGIGNIYADEALFLAKIHPRRNASALNNSEIKSLVNAIKEVLTLGIKYGGTSKNTYRTAIGTKGEMQNHLNVYGREGESCKVCGTLVEREKIGQRSSHFCPSCQR